MPTSGEQTYQSIIGIVDRYKTENDEVFPDGGRLVCQLPWIHQSSWLHRIFPPCPDEAIATLAPSTGRQPPHELVAFLRRANGMSIFNGSLNLYGVRGDFSRSPETALLLPYDLADHLETWSYLFGHDDFLIGSCGPNVDICVWRSEDGRVDRMNRTNGKVFESWPSFHDWLMLEAERFASLHLSNGRLVDPLTLHPQKAEPWPQKPHTVGRPVRWSPAWWWDLEQSMNLPFNTLPFGWLRKLKLQILIRLVRWLEDKK